MLYQNAKSKDKHVMLLLCCTFTATFLSLYIYFLSVTLEVVMGCTAAIPEKEYLNCFKISLTS